MSNLFINVPSQAANGAGAAVDFSTMGASKSIVVTGAWPETMQPTIAIEVNNDPGAAAGTWAPLVTFQGGGEKVADVAAHWIRAVVSNFKGGTAPQIDIGGQLEADPALFVQLVAPAGTGVGAAVNISALGSFKSIHTANAFRGTTIVEMSTDGATEWAQPFSTQAPGLQSGIFTASFARVRRVGVPQVNPGLPVVNIGATNPPGGGGVVGIDVEDEGVALAGNPYSTMNFVGAGVTATDVGGVATVNIPGGIGGLAIEDEGVPLAGPPYSTLNFVGAGVAAVDAGGGEATITVPGGATIQDEGAGIPNNPHAILNFIGGGVTATDAGGGVAAVTIPSAASQLGFQNFTYVVTGAEPDLSDFMVTIPVAQPTDTYEVEGSLAGVTAIVGIHFPDVVAGDRTTTQFRVVTTANMTAGDEIDFMIAT